MRGGALKKLTIAQNTNKSTPIMLPYVALVKSVKLISGSVSKVSYYDESFNTVYNDSISVVAGQETPVNKTISGFYLQKIMVMEIYL